MNIKIIKEEHQKLLDHEIGSRITVGSHMYGTNTQDSDYDMVCFYSEEALGVDRDLYLQGVDVSHVFQYDCHESNSQFIWTTYEQFFRNIFGGDSVLFLEAWIWGFQEHRPDLANEIRTYNILKCILGFVKRDLKYLKTSKDKGNRQHHIERGLYMAEKILNKQVPILSDLKSLPNDRPKEHMKDHRETLKNQLTEQYQNGNIKKYPVRNFNVNSLCRKLLNGMNTKEFKYE